MPTRNLSGSHGCGIPNLRLPRPWRTPLTSDGRGPLDSRGPRAGRVGAVDSGPGGQRTPPDMVPQGLPAAALARETRVGEAGSTAARVGEPEAALRERSKPDPSPATGDHGMEPCVHTPAPAHARTHTSIHTTHTPHTHSNTHSKHTRHMHAHHMHTCAAHAYTTCTHTSHHVAEPVNRPGHGKKNERHLFL